MRAAFSQFCTQRLPGSPIYFVLALLLCAPSMAFAGPLEALGLKVGASFTDQSLRFDNREADSERAHRGVAMAAFAEWHMPRIDRLRLVTEGLFIEKGFDSRALSYDANHIALPVLAKLTLLTGEIDLYLFTGPSFEVIPNAPPSGAYDDDRFVLSWHGGSGVSWKWLLGEVRYARDTTQAISGGFFAPDARSSHGWILQIGYQARVRTDREAH